MSRCRKERRLCHTNRSVWTFNNEITDKNISVRLLAVREYVNEKNSNYRSVIRANISFPEKYRT